MSPSKSFLSLTSTPTFLPLSLSLDVIRLTTIELVGDDQFSILVLHRIPPFCVILPLPTKPSQIPLHRTGKQGFVSE